MQVLGGAYGGGGYAAPRDDSNDGSSVDLEEEDEGVYSSPPIPTTIPVTSMPSPRQQQLPSLPSRRGGGSPSTPGSGRPPVPPSPQPITHNNSINTSAPLAFSSSATPHHQQPQSQQHVSMEELDKDADTPMMRVEMALRRMAVLPKLSDALYNPTNQKRSAADRYADANKAVADIRKCSPWRRHHDGSNNNNNTADQSGGYAVGGQEEDEEQLHLEAAGVSPHHQQSNLELELLGMYKKGGTSSFVDQSSMPYGNGGSGVNGTATSFQRNVGGGGGSVITFAHNSVFSETPKNRATPRRRMMSEAGENVLRRPSPHRQNQATSQLSQHRINSMTGGRRNSVNFNDTTSASQFQQQDGDGKRMSHPGGISRSGSMCSSAGSFATVQSVAGGGGPAPSSYFRDIHDDHPPTFSSPAQHHMSGYATPMTNGGITEGGKSVVVPVYDTVAAQLHISIRITVPQLLLHPILFPQLEEATVTLTPHDLACAFDTTPNPFSLRDLLALPTSTLTRGLCAAVLDILVYPAMQRWLEDTHNHHGGGSHSNNNHHTFVSNTTTIPPSPEELLEMGFGGGGDDCGGGGFPATKAVRDVLGPAIHLLQSLRYVSVEDVLAAWPTEAAFHAAKVPNPTEITKDDKKNKNNGAATRKSSHGAAADSRSEDEKPESNKIPSPTDSSSSEDDEEEEEYRRREVAANLPKFIYLSSPDSALGSYRELHAWGRQLTARHLVEGATQFRDVRRTRLPNGNLLEPANARNSTRDVPLEMFLLCRSRSDNDVGLEKEGVEEVTNHE